MPVQDLLSRLEKVRRTGSGTWSARCPAHDDKGPSLSVKETEDGKVLVHCFADCSVPNIVSAVGLKLEDLFPPRPVENAKRMRVPFPPVSVLESLVNEGYLVLMVANAVARGDKPSESDVRRLALAVQRLQAGLDLVKPHER